MLRYRITPLARADIRAILAHSNLTFGDLARRRYEALIVQAIRDIAAAPHRLGSVERPELRGRTYHLRYSRARACVAGAAVHNPRHLLLYRLEPGVVGIVRVLHDAMDVEQHLPAEDTP
ncbi:type II toxin-antitoxin system RelE/ParE family toxin [Nitrospirillum amazonense]|uniref:type II toxin-antitoxin system RelE/ParE family toxin n=1 Tax=Nitrospirillum amazonense TaxID=28077 RepID=UPI0011A31F4B|nr:type II toxin-antitoxin system RelE/ParE family toxin [Nitrospirillum amazonense]